MAIESLPKGWQGNGRTQVHLLGAAVMAAHTGANLRPDGSSLCASYLRSPHDFHATVTRLWRSSLQANRRLLSANGPGALTCCHPRACRIPSWNYFCVLLWLSWPAQLVWRCSSL